MKVILEKEPEIGAYELDPEVHYVVGKRDRKLLWLIPTEYNSKFYKFLTLNSLSGASWSGNFEWSLGDCVTYLLGKGAEVHASLI